MGQDAAPVSVEGLDVGEYISSLSIEGSHTLVLSHFLPAPSSPAPVDPPRVGGHVSAQLHLAPHSLRPRIPLTALPYLCARSYRGQFIFARNTSCTSSLSCLGDISALESGVEVARRRKFKDRFSAA